MQMRSAFIIVIVLVGSMLIAATATNDRRFQDLPPMTGGDALNYNHVERDLIEVKFREGLTIRLRNGQPTDLNNQSLQQADAAAAFQAVSGGVWTRVHAVSERDLDALQQRAERNAGVDLPDLNLWFRLKLPAGMAAAEAITLFSQLTDVETAIPVPKPVDNPVPPDYQDGETTTDIYQRYLDAAPDGIDARYAWEGEGGTGDTIKICDVERGINEKHEDLPQIKMAHASPSSAVTENSHNHGTAVIGQMAGKPNGWGVTGIAYDAEMWFGAALTASGGYNIAAAISACANDLSAGDVILIEQQIAGPNRPANPATGDQSGLVPVEWNKASYDAIKVAVASGIVVVEAAGNGAENLDDAAYSTGNGGHYPFLTQNDSGALIVGAGAPPNFQGVSPRARLSFSNYGATVDMQGWGTRIVTTGYGDLYESEGRNLWYRESFGGTSGASPIVAASAAIVQRTWELANGSPASPAQVKSLLRTTGTPQQGTDNIGPLPNLKAAIEEIWDVTPPSTPIITPGSGSYNMPLQADIDYGAGQDNSNTHIRFTLNGDEPTIDSYIFIPEFDDALYFNYGVTVKVKAFQSNPTAGRVFASETASATYVSSTPKVDTPQINPGGGVYNQPHQVTITTDTSGATIRYRTDGRSPSFFYPGTEYTGPISLDPGTYEITARGYKDGYYKSDVAYSGDITVNALVLPAPTVYPNGGNFNGSVTVYIGSTVLGADIRYTLDGTDPTETSPQFTDPIFLTETSTVKARIYLDGYTPSDVVSKTFNVTTQANIPVINPNGGTYNDTVSVSLSTTTVGATIRYTTNGAEPTSYSTVYSGPFNQGVGQHTVKAKAFLLNALPSETATAEFEVLDTTAPKVAAPVLQPFSTQYFVEPFSVTMYSDTAGASIYYTFASDMLPPDPTQSDDLYTGPVPITTTGNYFFKARAFKGGLTNSDITQSGQLSLGDALGSTALPTITPNGGTYTNSVQVTFSANQFETIFYTSDGSEPVSVPPVTLPSKQYNQGSSPPVNIFKPTTINAKAYRNFFASGGMASAEFYFICDTPVITPASSTYTETVSVSMGTGTTGGNTKITYTTDGSEPSDADTEYTTPFDLGVGEHTVKARCFRSDYVPSETAVRVFVVKPTPIAPSYLIQPQSQTVAGGTNVTFTSSVTGTPEITYQWQRDGIDIAGEVEPELVIPAATGSDAGLYRVVARNSAGDVASTEAELTVTGPNLIISKTGLLTATVGGLVTYTLTVSNSGDQAASNLIISDTVPAASTYISGGTLVDGTVTWSAPSLNMAESLTRTFTVSATQTITNSQYSVSSNEAVAAFGNVIVVTQIKTINGDVEDIRVYLPLLLK